MKRLILRLTLLLVVTCNTLSAQTNNHPVHVFITAGQSNTDGRVKNTLLPACIKALTTDSTFEKGSYRFCKISQNRNDGQFVNYWPKGRITDGMWTYDAVVYYKLEQLLQEDFYVVKYAVGGTSIQFPNDTAKGRYWSANPDFLKRTMSYEKKGHSLLLSFTESIDAAIDQTLSKLADGYKIDAFLWHQGESDDVYADLYYDNLKQLIRYVRSHLTEKTGKDYSELPFVFGSIPTSNRHYRPQIEAAMKRIAKEDSNAYLIDMSEGELQNDRTHFTEKSAEYLGNEMYKVLDKIVFNDKHTFYVAKYKNDKSCAISYTFDDGYDEHATLVAPKMEKLGFRGTFWVNGATIDKNDSLKQRASWDQLKKMSKKGHEISNHGWSHKNLTRLSMREVKSEIFKNDSAIQLHTGKRPVTYCYAYNAKNDSVIALASENRVDTRTEQFSVGGKSTFENLEKRVENLINNQSWGVTMTHGITHGYDRFSNANVFWEHLEKVKKQEDKIWVGTFKEVGAYIKERDALKYDIVTTKNGYIISPTLQLDKKLFDEPLTGVLKLSDFRKIKISQKNKLLRPIIMKDKICFDFNPYNGPVKITIN